MKAFVVPTVLLISILLGSMWTGISIRQDAQQWVGELDALTEAQAWGDWAAVEERILTLYQEWNQRKTVLHTIIKHQDLAETEKLFEGAVAACREKDSVELHILLKQLETQILFIAETQQADVKNIL